MKHPINMPYSPRGMFVVRLSRVSPHGHRPYVRRGRQMLFVVAQPLLSTAMSARHHPSATDHYIAVRHQLTTIQPLAFFFVTKGKALIIF